MLRSEKGRRCLCIFKVAFSFGFTCKPVEHPDAMRWPCG